MKISLILIVTLVYEYSQSVTQKNSCVIIMDSIRGEGYEVEFVPVKALPENKLGITFKGNGVGYLEAHKIIKAITGMTGEVLVKNGLEMTVIDTPRNKPTKI